MVLAQKQKYRPMEQDRKPRSKPMYLWVPYLLQRTEAEDIKRWQGYTEEVYKKVLMTRITMRG